MARDRELIARLTTGQARLEAFLLAQERQRPLLADLDARLSREPIADTIHEALDRADVEEDPSVHLHVSELLPPDFYRLLLETIPPPECFRYADKTKQEFEPHEATLIPEASKIVWTFFEDDIVEGVLLPALLKKFGPHLRSHYEGVFGSEFADEALGWRQRTRGRLMLRRPGYALAPHLDPKKMLFTCLIYFARPGDSEEHGTQLYQVDRPVQSSSLKTFYPEQHGFKCTLARTVPFWANSAFAFMNARAAHAASIPTDSTQTERYAYQFYAAPSGSAFAALVSKLPAERQALFEGITVRPEAGPR